MPTTKRETSDADVTLQPQAKLTSAAEDGDQEGAVRTRAGQLSASLIRSQFGGSRAASTQLKRAQVQRQAVEEEEEEEEEVQLKRAPVQRQAVEEEEEEEEEVQLKRAPVQLQPEEEEEQEEEEETVQAKRKAGAQGSFQLSSGSKRGKDARNSNPHSVAASGVEGASTPLPHLERIQPAFGGHDLSSVRTAVGGAAAQASDALGADAYATGNTIGFRAAPDLHTAAHEAAHVVQQRAGVQLKGDVGEVGDQYEQNADAVADRVVQGRSAEDLLEPFGGRREGQEGAARSAHDPSETRTGDASSHRGIVTLQRFPATPDGATPRDPTSAALQLQRATTKKKRGKRGIVGRVVSVKALRARLMVTPEFLGASVATLRRGHRVLVLKKVGSWYKVRFGKKEGYLHRNRIVTKVIRLRSGYTGSGTTRGEAELSGRG